MHLQIADGVAHAQLPFIEAHIRYCRIWLAITGDDYANVLSELTDKEKINVAAIRMRQGLRSTFGSLKHDEAVTDPFAQ